MTALLQQSGFAYAVPPYANVPIKNVTAAYLVRPSDNGWVISCSSASSTISLPPATTLPIGFNCFVWNINASNIIIDPNGSETIDSSLTLNLRQGEGTQIICNGINWSTGNKKTMRLYSENGSAAGRASAAGDSSIAIGWGASTTPTDCLAIGLNSSVSGGGTSALAIGRSANASNGDASAVGRNSIASGDSSAAFGKDATSSGTSSLALGRLSTASSTSSTAIGQNSSSQGAQAVTGSGAMSLGGSYASGADSFAAGILSNTGTYGAQGGNSVAIGLRAVATDTSSLSMMNDSQSRSSYSIAIGWIATASSTSFKALALGSEAQATRTYSTAIGPSISNMVGKYTYTGVYFASYGDVQTGTSILCCATTGAVATVLTTDNGAAGNTNQIILPNSSAYSFTGTVVARRQAAGGTDSAAWKIEGLIRREGTAASTTLVASTVTAISNVPGWTLALSADTTNGGLAVTATGAATTNIRWVATVQTSEVTYA